MHIPRYLLILITTVALLPAQLQIPGVVRIHDLGGLLEAPITFAGPRHGLVPQQAPSEPAAAEPQSFAVFLQANFLPEIAAELARGSTHDAAKQVWVLHAPVDLQTHVAARLQELRAQRARQIHVNLHIEPARLTLRVEDDGEGFDVEEARARGLRLGLTSMDERASSVRGSLQIDSQPGEGTTVTLEAPLE